MPQSPNLQSLLKLRISFNDTDAYPVPPSQDFIILTMNNSSVPSQPLQVCLSASQKRGMPVAVLDASYEDRRHAEEVYYPVIFQYTGGPAHLPYELRYMTAHPLLISDRFLVDLRLFHEALAIALSNIVQRWFTDKEAAFPTRMPLEPHEEDLLKVLSSILYRSIIWDNSANIQLP